MVCVSSYLVRRLVTNSDIYLFPFGLRLSEKFVKKLFIDDDSKYIWHPLLLKAKDGSPHSDPFWPQFNILDKAME